MRTKMNAVDMLDVLRGVWRISTWPCSKVLWGQWVERKGGRNFAFCLSSTAGRESNALRRPYGWWLSLANWANLRRMKNRQRLSASDREKLWAVWKEKGELGWWGNWAETAGVLPHSRTIHPTTENKGKWSYVRTESLGRFLRPSVKSTRLASSLAHTENPVYLWKWPSIIF